jgi:hypothetical protein
MNKRFHIGRGNWRYFDLDLDHVFRLVNRWRAQVERIDRPWLCWHVDPDWCLVQQDLVLQSGWTPVVGGDPRRGQPPLRDGAVRIDFNAGLDLPCMSMHFPLEFAWLWAGERLAFWHSDLIVRPERMNALARDFEHLPNGVVAAVPSRVGWRGLVDLHWRRYFELIGCTTNRASQSQWLHGCGWWRHFGYHPLAGSESERRIRKRCFWDHGTGIMWWERYCGGKVHRIPGRPLNEGHCSSSKIDIKRGPQTDMGDNLTAHWRLDEVCARLGVTLPQHSRSAQPHRTRDVNAA